mmetsp:Transcript_57280/g.134472  ORF Transcript_57280/g.134472 Transcript_57280/m.134472 type:complete len:198 (-) Transcript_57280:219-812(-)
MAMVSEPNVSSVVVLDLHGERIAAQYFADTLQTHHAQQQFEKTLLSKALKSTSGGECDITVFDGHIAVFRGGKDVFLFVTGDQDENEIILVEVLNALYNAYASLLGSVDRGSMLDRLDDVLLALDELVDGGVILEIESSAIVNRVGMKGSVGSAGGASAGGAGGAGGTPLQAQTPKEALLSLRDQMKRAFNTGGFSS